MRFLFSIIFSFFLGIGLAQNSEFMIWTELGVSYKPLKPLTTSIELNSRFYPTEVQTFFPQFTVKYKLLDWFSPSVDYRFLVDKNKYGNYKTSSRINFNANFDYELHRFEIGFRARYQFGFKQIAPTNEYNPDFDQAFRFKPSISYNIKGVKFTPNIGAEWFYRPTGGGPYFPGFYKVRLSGGGKYNLKGPHEVGFKYQLDKKFHSNDGLRHVISISYGYEIK